MTKTEAGKRDPSAPRIGYIRLEPEDTDISSQALLLDAIGSFRQIVVEHAVESDWSRRDQLLDALQPGDIVYAASAGRFCTGARDLVQTAKRISECKADLVLLEEGVDTRTPSGRIALRLADALAASASKTASQARKEGIRRAKEKGRRIGRPPVAVPANFRDICRAWSEGRLSGREAAERSGLRPTSFYNKAAILGYLSPARRRRTSESGDNG